MSWSVDNFLRRRWRSALVILLPGVLLSVLLLRPQPPLYRAEAAFIVGQRPLADAQGEQSRYYRWVGSEQAVRTLSDWLNTTAFVEQVAERLQRRGYDISMLEVGAAFEAGSNRSRLILAVQHSDEQLVEEILFVASDLLLVERIATLPIDQAAIELFPIDSRPAIEQLETGQMNRWIALAILLGAILLAFSFAWLAEMLDPTIHTAAELQPLALEVLGEIPPD